MKRKLYQITESQYKNLLSTLKEGEEINSIPKKLIVTESQYRSIIKDVTKSEINEGIFDGIKPEKKELKLTDGKYSKGINDYSDLEFCEMIIDSIKGLYGDSEDAVFDRYELPSWLTDMGMTSSSYKELLIGNGLIKLVDSGDGNFSHKVVKKGIMKNLLNLKGAIIDLNKPSENIEITDELPDESPMSDINEDLEPKNVESGILMDTANSTEGINELDYSDVNQNENSVDSDESFENGSQTNVIENIIFNTNTFALVQTNNGEILFFDKMGNENPQDTLDNLEVVTNPSEFVSDYDTAISLTSENINELISEMEGLGYSDTDEEIVKLKNHFSINEMTTTGSVGGQYETPFAWSKNPKKGKQSETPTMNGGKFVK